MQHSGHSTNNNTVIFDLATGQFWAPWYNMGQGGWFSNLGLSRLPSLTFQVGYDVDPKDFDPATDAIPLSAINDFDLSTLILDDPNTPENEANMIAIDGGNRVMKTGHNTYMLMPAMGANTLAETSSLEFDYKPFFREDGAQYIGDADGAGHFNEGEAIAVEQIQLSSGDALIHSNGSEILTYTRAEVETSTGRIGNATVEGRKQLGYIYVVEEENGDLVVEFYDLRTESAHQKISGFSIERANGTSTPDTEAVDTIVFYNLGEYNASSATGTDTAQTGGEKVPFSGGSEALGRLMPLAHEGFEADGDGQYDAGVVTPTHIAVGGDWNSASSWVDADGNPTDVPGDAAIIHIPESVEITASGDISSGSHVFMVRVDGTLTLESPDGADTTLKVDTIFTTNTGTLNIDADDSTDGTVDIAITPLDLNAQTWTHDGATEAYYTDNNNGKGWDDKRTDAATGSIGDDNGDGYDGVLGRFSWDPDQISLGIVSHGTTKLNGQAKLEHIEHTGIEAGATSFVIDFDPSENGWSVDDRLMIGADLLPKAPSFITRVCEFGFHILHRQFGQARHARSPQIAQVLDALLRVFGFPAMNEVGRCCSRIARGLVFGGHHPKCRRSPHSTTHPSGCH